MTPISNHNSYLPSYESRVVSESRVARINDLYNKTKKNYQHRDSVISNNSTSVQDTDFDDQCRPLTNVPDPIEVQSHSQDEPTVTIKPETVSNPFHSGILENSIAPEDNYEEELQFTPKLRSKKSIISFRSSRLSTPIVHDKSKIDRRRRNSVSDADTSNPIFNIKRRVRSRKERLRELKQQLGDPVPLDYLNRDNQPDMSSMLERRDAIEARWKRILSHDRNLSHRKLEGSHLTTMNEQNSQNEVGNSSVLHDDGLANSTIDSKSITSTLGSLQSMSNDQLTEIREGIRSNSERLDEIIALLCDKNANDNKEVFLWAFCIIILIILNIYVYKL